MHLFSFDFFFAVHVLVIWVTGIAHFYGFWAYYLKLNFFFCLCFDCVGFIGNLLAGFISLSLLAE